MVSCRTEQTAAALSYQLRCLTIYHGKYRLAGSHVCLQFGRGGQAEYIFILLGIIAIAVAFMLRLSSGKHPELELDTPAGKK